MTFSDPATGVILAIIIGTLGAIVYALRVLVLLERRIARIDAHIEMVVKKIIREELAIEAEEKKIQAEIGSLRKSPRRAKKRRR